jgi:succinoglycan biosynthesis protein ExoV
VRGPHTAALLGLDPALAITDPAVMVQRLFPFASVPKTYNHAYMPHFTEELSSGDAWRRACRISGMHYIDPTLPIAEVMRQVAATRVLLTEAMHGAIVADAFRVPFIPVASKTDINSFKWRDWGDSMHIPIRLHRLHRVGSLLNCANPLRAAITVAVAFQLFLIKRRSRPQLSTDQQLEHCCCALINKFELVATAYDKTRSF